MCIYCSEHVSKPYTLNPKQTLNPIFEPGLPSSLVDPKPMDAGCNELGTCEPETSELGFAPLPAEEPPV